MTVTRLEPGDAYFAPVEGGVVLRRVSVAGFRVEGADGSLFVADSDLAGAIAAHAAVRAAREAEERVRAAAAAREIEAEDAISEIAMGGDGL